MCEQRKANNENKTIIRKASTAWRIELAEGGSSYDRLRQQQFIRGVCGRGVQQNSLQTQKHLRACGNGTCGRAKADEKQLKWRTSAGWLHTCWKYYNMPFAIVAVTFKIAFRHFAFVMTASRWCEICERALMSVPNGVIGRVPARISSSWGDVHGSVVAMFYCTGINRKHSS